MRFVAILPLLLACLCVSPAAHALNFGPRNATILIIRHAEKAERKGDPALSPAGDRRAGAYPGFFEKLKLDGAPVHLDFIFGTKDSPNSVRPRLTLEPLAEKLHLPIKLMFEDERYLNLVLDLRTGEFDHKTTLICWHHAKISELIHELGGKPRDLFGQKEWDEAIYHWMVVLRFGPKGEMTESYVINEHILPTDLKDPPAPPAAPTP